MLTPQLPADAPNLLIIDDEGPLRTAVMRWFTRRGWRCAEAASMEEAERMLFCIGASSPDAIICDQNLPDGKGEQLLDRITRERPQLADRMILATGEVFAVEKERRLMASGCQMLSKPFDLQQAEQLAKSVIEHAHTPALTKSA